MNKQTQELIIGHLWGELSFKKNNDSNGILYLKKIFQSIVILEKNRGEERQHFFIEECRLRNVEGMTAVEYQHLEATVVFTDSGKSHLWMLKPLGEGLAGSGLCECLLPQGYPQCLYNGEVCQTSRSCQRAKLTSCASQWGVMECTRHQPGCVLDKIA